MILELTEEDYKSAMKSEDSWCSCCPIAQCLARHGIKAHVGTTRVNIKGHYFQLDENGQKIIHLIDRGFPWPNIALHKRFEVVGYEEVGSNGGS